MEVSIGDDGLEGALAVVCDAMLGTCEPAKQVCRAVIEQVWDEMMTDTNVGFAFAVGESRSFAVESKSHEHMTFFRTFPQNWG